MLQIQLNFTNASQISPHIDQDTLVFHAKEAVFGQELILKSKIKPQISTTVKVEAIKSTAKGIKVIY